MNKNSRTIFFKFSLSIVCRQMQNLENVIGLYHAANNPHNSKQVLVLLDIILVIYILSTSNTFSGLYLFCPGNKVKTQVSSLQSWMSLKTDENKIFEVIKCCPFYDFIYFEEIIIFSFKRCDNIVCNRLLLQLKDNEAYKRVGCPISLSEFVSKFGPFGGFLGLVIY